MTTPAKLKQKERVLAKADQRNFKENKTQASLRGLDAPSSNGLLPYQEER
jgi:hypothetical protein